MLKIGYGTDAKKATTEIDKEIVASIVESKMFESAMIPTFGEFRDELNEMFDTAAIADYLKSKEGEEAKPEEAADVELPAKPKSVFKFQTYVISKKGDNTILGKGGPSGFGNDNKWGPKTAKAWAKYGKEFVKAGLDKDKTTQPPVKKTAPSKAKASYADADYKNMANELETAMSGLGTKDNVVEAVFKKIHTKMDWGKLAKAYGNREGKTLIATLQSDGVLVTAMDIMRANGIPFKNTKPAAAAPATKSPAQLADNKPIPGTGFVTGQKV